MPPKVAAVNDSPVPPPNKASKARSTSNSRGAANYAESTQVPAPPRSTQTPTLVNSPLQSNYAFVPDSSNPGPQPGFSEVNEPATGTPLKATSRAFVPRNLQTLDSEEVDVEGPTSVIVHQPPRMSFTPAETKGDHPPRNVALSIFRGIPIMNQFAIYDETLHASVERYHVSWDQWLDEDLLTLFGAKNGTLPGRPRKPWS
ncbi:hypothetical protein HYPSUDRAFT_201160 [Hypholoma sublateritium FD-334 SS-4]|uniref:Uncharacterized protein n=1 Tax=Hypholoma sublateritium (strain FD-334 SS-4) TaxID=945553 RepID=A0A0D2L968_HYPSF|nr:hypothetical protein HYPSUDRAFT_201160 [Hypholoma sublateritium FD-334 SS-4]